MVEDHPDIVEMYRLKLTSLAALAANTLVAWLNSPMVRLRKE